MKVIIQRKDICVLSQSFFSRWRNIFCHAGGNIRSFSTNWIDICVLTHTKIKIIVSLIVGSTPRSGGLAIIGQLPEIDFHHRNTGTSESRRQEHSRLRGVDAERGRLNLYYCVCLHQITFFKYISYINTKNIILKKNN